MEWNLWPLPQLKYFFYLQTRRSHNTKNFFIWCSWQPNYTPICCPRQPNRRTLWQPGTPNFTPFWYTQQPNSYLIFVSRQYNFTKFCCPQKLNCTLFQCLRPQHFTEFLCLQNQNCTPVHCLIQQNWTPFWYPAQTIALDIGVPKTALRSMLVFPVTYCPLLCFPWQPNCNQFLYPQVIFTLYLCPWPSNWTKFWCPWQPNCTPFGCPRLLNCTQFGCPT